MNAARRIAESLGSELQAFIFDADIVDGNIVSEIVSRMGATGILSRWEENGLTVYYINRRKLARRCLYEECSGLEGVARDRCVEQCIQATTAKLANSLAQGVIEAVESGKQAVHQG